MQVTTFAIAVLIGMEVSQHDCVQALLGSGLHHITLEEAPLTLLFSSYGCNVDRQHFPFRLALLTAALLCSERVGKGGERYVSS